MRIVQNCHGCEREHGFDYQGLRSISLESGCDRVLFNDLDTVVRMSEIAAERETLTVGSGFNMETDWR